jgi:hypothetical protein
MEMAQYVMRIIKSDCVDASGVDFFGSDEPLWVFTARGRDGVVHTTRSKEFSNVDSGKTFDFATDNDRNIVWTRKGASKGASGPIALSIQLWDVDQGEPEEIAEKTKKAFDFGEQVPVVGEWIEKVPSVVRDGIAKFIGSDLMGSKTFLYPAARLAKQLPSVGAKFREKHRFGGHDGDLPFAVAGGPDYGPHIEVTRVA